MKEKDLIGERGPKKVSGVEYKLCGGALKKEYVEKIWVKHAIFQY